MSEPFVNLDAVFNLAVEETQELIQYGFNLSDPCIVTSLEWYANKYPEIAERCNNALLEFIDKQAADFPQLVAVPSEIDMEGF